MDDNNVEHSTDSEAFFSTDNEAASSACDLRSNDSLVKEVKLHFGRCMFNCAEPDNQHLIPASEKSWR